MHIQRLMAVTSKVVGLLITLDYAFRMQSRRMNGRTDWTVLKRSMELTLQSKNVQTLHVIHLFYDGFKPIQLSAFNASQKQSQLIAVWRAPTISTIDNSPIQ